MQITEQFYKVESGAIVAGPFLRPKRFGKKTTDSAMAENGIYRLWIDTPSSPGLEYYQVAGAVEVKDDKLVRTDTWSLPEPVPDITPEEEANMHLFEVLSNGFNTAFIKVMDDALPGHDVFALLRAQLKKNASPPIWSKTEHYSVGDIVTYNNRKWVALPDVADSPPDYVFEEDDATGGWIPVDY